MTEKAPPSVSPKTEMAGIDVGRDEVVVSAADTNHSLSTTTSSASKRAYSANAEEGNEVAAPIKRSKAENSTSVVEISRTEDSKAKEAVVTRTSASAVAATTTFTTTPYAAEDSVASTSADEPLDLATTLGFKAGDRIEVQWTIHYDDDDDDDDDEGNAQDDDLPPENTDPPKSTTTIVWWKATLLEHDGRTTDSVAIRSLLYDARPDLGFPEPSKEDVVFMGHDLLVSPDDDTVHLKYKREGLTEEENQVISFGTDEQLEEQLNQVVMGALQKNQQAWKAIPAAAQAAIAEKMQNMKEKLKHKLQSLGSQGQVITSETIHQLLAQSF